MTTSTTTTTMIAMTTMTKHAKDAPRRTSGSKSRSRQGASDKIWAVGLAGVTCVGLVGTLAVRAAQDAAASTAPTDSQVAIDASQSEADAQYATTAYSSSGLTEQQLDEYARALESERLRLEAYHAELLDVAARLQESADALSQARGVIPAGASSGAKSKKANSSNADSSNGDSNTGKANSQPTTDAPQASTSPAQPAAQPQPAAKPVPKPAAAPQVAKPQAQTRGS